MNLFWIILSVLVVVYLVLGGLLILWAIGMNDNAHTNVQWWQLVWYVITWPRVFWEF